MVPQPERRDFLRVREICARSGLSKSRVHALLAQGKLEAVKLDGTLLVRADSYERLIQAATPYPVTRRNGVA
jgi:excisionase family DNA binding protein